LRSVVVIDDRGGQARRSISVRARSVLRAALLPTVAALVLVVSTAVSAAPGDLDTSFSKDGMKVVDGGGEELSLAVLVQDDGRIVVAGAEITALGDLCLARLKSGGGLDTSFTGDGVATFDFAGGGLNDEVRDLAQLPNGKLIAVGSAATAGAPLATFAVARLLPNGDLDPDFSGDGMTRIAFQGEEAWGNAVAVQTDGRILVAGGVSDPATADQDFAVVRLRRSGALDLTYGEQGRVRTDLGADDVIEWIALQDDGRLVVGGNTAADGVPVKTAFARYTVSGDLDTTFSGDGKRVVDMVRTLGEVRGGGLAIRSDGKIVAAFPVPKRNGTLPDNAYAVGLVRIKPGGALDATFSGDGKRVSVPLEDGVKVEDMVLDADGRLIVSGSSWLDGVFVARYKPKGALDPTFGDEGSVVTLFPLAANGGMGSASAIQPNGRIVVAAQHYLVSTGLDFAVARYLP